jgi:hypothetical protein
MNDEMTHARLLRELEVVFGKEAPIQTEAELHSLDIERVVRTRLT